MSSFGPTAALASLSNNLHQTLASGNRVLNILEEKPMVEDIVGQEDMPVGDIKAYRAGVRWLPYDLLRLTAQ